jgi:hypothetical protein
MVGTRAHPSVLQEQQGILMMMVMVMMVMMMMPMLVVLALVIPVCVMPVFVGVPVFVCVVPVFVCVVPVFECVVHVPVSSFKPLCFHSRSGLDLVHG